MNSMVSKLIQGNDRNVKIRFMVIHEEDLPKPER